MIGGVQEGVLGVDQDAVTSNSHISLFFRALPPVVHSHLNKHPDALGESITRAHSVLVRVVGRNLFPVLFLADPTLGWLVGSGMSIWPKCSCSVRQSQRLARTQLLISRR